MSRLDKFYKLHSDTYKNTDDIWIDHISRLEAISEYLITNIQFLWVFVLIALAIGMIGVIL